MSKKELKLVKSEKSTAKAPRQIEAQPKPPVPETPELTPAEEAEIARFKALTAKRAARKALIHRVIARLEAQENVSNAA